MVLMALSVSTELTLNINPLSSQHNLEWRSISDNTPGVEDLTLFAYQVTNLSKHSPDPRHSAKLRVPDNLTLSPDVCQFYEMS
jgi:hypothetical protein